METGKYCAYNVTRNTLLSDQVTVAESALGSLQILGLVMRGPGAHQESAVWLTGLSRPPDLPRVVSFDILYLDEAKRVIACGSVGAETNFPELHDSAVSALILYDQRLAQTATGPGDQLQICLQADLPAVLKAVSHSTKGPDTSADSEPGRSNPAVMRFEVIRPAVYVYDPFVGTLMYLPEFPELQPFGTELFLPQTQSIPPTDLAVEASEPQELPAISSSPLETGLAAAASDESLIETRFEVPIEENAGTGRPNQKEPPRFYHPEPIRFFDPAAAAAENQNTTETPEEPVPNEAIPTHSGNVLSPELKSAIQHIDELFRQEQSSKQKGGRKKKPGSRSKSAKETATEPTGGALPEFQSMPETEIAAETPLQLPTLSGPPASHAPEPSAPQALRSAAPIEPPTASPPVEMEAERPEVSDSPEPLASPAPAEEEAQPILEPEPAEPLSALAETTPEIELIEASLTATAESVPEIPIATVLAESANSELSSQPSPLKERPAPRKKKKPPARKEQPKEKLSLATRIERWILGNVSELISDGKRRAPRFQLPGLVAFYFSGGTPRPHEVVNISKSGFYVRTRELWFPDTLVRMTLERPRASDDRAPESISILARVVRTDDEGAGHEFVTIEDLMALHTRDVLPPNATDRAQLESFLKQD
jgi:hypothetical protein